MGYIALYRKYRPDKFKDIVGQENITSILKSQIKNLKTSHAYIFSGSRGTGKTSAAKIFARAINCLHPEDGEPCNECEACKNILSGDTTDVVEMDAASNNSVENIRQIRNEVVYAATSVKYRVYIIDEVHMLTTSAFNALLKTLEEPPENVVFILATTEQHKIPVTILSRCLRFEFSKISEEDIKKRVIHVLDEEKVGYELEAVEYISKLADGALRDALSILDRCLSEKEEILKLAKVEEIIGATSKDILKKLVNYILNKNNIELIDTINLVINKGKDLRQLIYSLTEEFLKILVDSKSKEESIIISDIITELSKLDNEIRLSVKPTILIKSALIRISNFSSENGMQNVLTNVVNSDNSLTNNKINKLENEINELKNIFTNIKIETKPKNNIEVTLADVKQEKNSKVDLDIENLKVFKNYENFKNSVVSKGKLKLFSTLAGSNMYTNDDNVVITTNNEFAYKMLLLDDQKEIILNILKDEYNIDKPLIIKLKKQIKENKIEKILKDNSVEYTNLD
jgi:DNA polymerase-3 subunit gamma/tau